MSEHLSERDTCAGLLKAAGDPLRLDILRVLANDSFGVLELCHIFEIKQSGMSHHLKVLATAGLLSTRKEGNSVFYRRHTPAADDVLNPLRQSIFQSIDTFSLDNEIQARVREIYQQRADASQRFFAENTGRFREQQDLIAAFDVYGSQVNDALVKEVLPSNQLALEIGPGEGEMLEFLSPKFEHVIALDTSAAMLEKCRSRAEHLSLKNIECIHNDSRYCRDLPEQVDCVVINMVLHHVPSPSVIFEDVSRALKPGGLLLVCDLSAHNQDWTREACGDLWLGLPSEDLVSWAAQHHLIEGQRSFFALRNGFQIQIHGFTKQKLKT